MSTLVRLAFAYAILAPCIPGVAAAADITVRIGEVSVATGQSQVSVPIRAAAGPKLAAGRVVMTYNPALLELDSVEQGAVLKSGNALQGFTVNEPGKVTMNFASVDGVDGEGDLFHASFRLLPRGINGKSSPLAIERVLAWRADNEVDLAVETVDGSIGLVAQVRALPTWWLISAGVVLAVLLLLARRMFRRKPAHASNGHRPDSS
ncbi:MAG: cohesin domain-containing protein [Pirellulales bacterium]